MSFDTNQKTKLDIAFKKLLNKSTLNINDVANSEPIGTNVSISTSTIFAETITSTPGVTGITADANYSSDTTVEHIRFIATAHPDSNIEGKYHAYTLSLPVTYEARSTQANKTTIPFGNNKILYESLGKLQLIPPSFGGSYAAKPYRAGTENTIGSGTEIPPLATEAWVIDYYSGILYLENPTNDLITFVDAYLYIGDMADQNSSSSSSDLISEGKAKVETTDDGTNSKATFTTNNTPRWDVTHSGHIIPTANASYDIGNAEYKVRHLFLSDNSLTIGDTALSADGGVLKWGDDTLAKSTDITSGTANKANALATSVNIAGVSFDGSSNIDIPAISTTTTIIYCDANRPDTYTEDGTIAYPYKSLSDAITAKCTDSSTETVVFYLASGNYIGTISLTKTSLNQEIYIVGENKESVRIMGSNTFNTSTGNVLFLRRFKNVSVQNLTIMNGAYGFYPRECTTTSIVNCIFRNCGSSGDATMHNGSGSESQQAKYKWTSGDALATHTSDGGAMRVRACNDIEIRDNLIEYCFRGFRIQDCHRGNISSNRVHRILDNGIYLAAGSYDGSISSGCENLSVTNNIVEHAGHHGLLVVGGRNNTFKNNVIKHSWGTAYNGAHAVNVDLIDNYFYNNNCKNYNGYGPGGEHLAQIYAYALTNIDQSANTKYLIQVINNVFEESGNGSAGTSKLFYINSVKSSLPTAAQVISVHNNAHDCATNYDISDWQVTYPKATFSSDEISEGITNQYYTDTRTINAVQSNNIDMGSNTITTTGQIKYSNVYATEADLPSASTYHGMFVHVHATGKAYYAHGGSWIKILDESSSSTSNLIEGSNLYHTDARSRASVSVNDAGGDGNLAYNNSTGVITYTGPSSTEVQAHITAGTGVGISSGQVSIGQPVDTTDDVQFKDISASGNVIVTGDLTINGTTTTIATTNTTVADSLIELGNGTSGSPANDSGIVIERGDQDNAFIGFDESADKFTLGTGSFTGATTGNLAIATGTLVANVEGSITGNATTSTALQTARTIGGVSFDGSANINLPGVNTVGNQDTTGNAATATTASAITGVTATTAEINLLDGVTTATSTTIVDADRIILNDAGTMKQVAVSDLKTYTGGGGASNLNGLSDVGLSSTSAGQVLKYDGSSWVNVNHNINGVSDVIITGTPDPDHVIKWDNTSQVWANQKLDYSQIDNTPAVPTTLTSLTNVSAFSPSNGQVLTYVSSSNNWQPQNASSGSSTEFKFAIITDAGDHTITNSTETHQTFLFNKGTGAVILPKGVTAGTIYNIKNINTNQLELQCPTTGTATLIDGAATTRNLNQWDNITLIKYGSAEDWAIL